MPIFLRKYPHLYGFYENIGIRPVEENYKLVKEKIGLTNFRGYSENSVLQEFWISVLLANLALAIKRETDGIVDSTINQKGNQNKYMTNMNELVGYLSRHIGEYMDADTDTEKYGIIRCISDSVFYSRKIYRSTNLLYHQGILHIMLLTRNLYL